jgi:predicted DNA binding CopG/RHH family protein
MANKIKKKLPDPFADQQLDAYEQEVEDYVNSLDPNDIKPLSRKQRAWFRKVADNTLKHLEKEKKTKNINLRLKESELKAIKAKSARVGLPYQTLITTLIHQYLQGKIHITL